MIEIKKNRSGRFFSTDISKLIKKKLPNISFLHALLVGNIKGKIYVERLIQTKSVFFITATNYCFLIGNLNTNFFESCLTQIKSKGNFRLFCQKKNKEKILSTFSSKTIRHHYQLPEENKHYYFHPAPDFIKKCTLHDINKKFLNQCAWGEIKKPLYEVNKNNKIICPSKCLIYQNEIIAESYSVVGNNHAEIGVTVKKTFQSLGLATYLCSLLINELQSEKLKIHWTCNGDNYPSQKIALKLGFKKADDYIFWEAGGK